jgi:hypothetical protein
MKGIFDTKANSGYDDEITRRYHFPPQYRSIADKLVGEHDKVWGGSAYGSISAGSRGSMGQSVT